LGLLDKNVISFQIYRILCLIIETIQYILCLLSKLMLKESYFCVF
jgi:hypothetical protein